MLATLGLSLCLGLMSPELGVIGDGPMGQGAGTNAAQADALVDVSNEPPNEPAAASLKGQNLEIRYWGGVVLGGVVKGNARIETSSKAPDASGPITQEITITASGGTLSLHATLSGSAESFPCEFEPDATREAVVRHSVGLSRSLLNRGVYDRHGDWVLGVRAGASAIVTPEEQSGTQGNKFTLKATGEKIVLVFRPRFYQKHRGLRFFEPWNSPLWTKPVVGWCSWFAYMDKITQEDVYTTTDVLAEKLGPYGLTYVQIDDGFQQAPAGLPDRWLTTNPKFPDGLRGMVSHITGKGLVPGLWLAAGFLNDEEARANPELFLKNSSGGIAKGKWVGNVPDYANPATIDRLVHSVYRPLHEMGWKYIKLDALRHVRYEGFNSFPESFAARGLDRAKVYRDYVRTVRDDLGGAGSETFLMACWGVRPELAGLVDGCRLGTDGFRWGCLEQYNSFNNVVWLNDPDHIELKPGADYLSCMVTSMTGSLFMITDPAERYKNEDLDCVRRCIPVLFTRPGQVFDVDPSRSSRIAEADTCRDGGPPTPFDGNEHSVTNMVVQELNTSYESWIVLGLTGPHEAPIDLRSLGLSGEKKYVVFDVWTKRLVGVVSGQFTPPAIDPKYQCGLYCFREMRDRPQFVATSRHISCGAFDVSDVTWMEGQSGGGVLAGVSTLVPGDPYEVFIHEPGGNTGARVSVDTGARVLSSERVGGLRRVTLMTSGSTPVHWKVEYADVR
ncbi:MAG: alpha-galactosidase [Phycisphaerales bacterium]|nr:alpha-galactosidase [Phycisphaerales bacterium]